MCTATAAATPNLRFDRTLCTGRHSAALACSPPWRQCKSPLKLRVSLRMNVYVSRGSVAAGDDVDAPNSDSFAVPDGTPLEEIVGGIAKSGYLPQIAGGQASWSVTSNVPVAVVAQQWVQPRMFFLLRGMKELDSRDGVLRLYFNYHAQVDPETVYEILWGFRLNAI